MKTVDAISETEVRTIISKKLDDNEFVVENYEEKAASEDPMGFLGVHILLKVSVNHRNQNKYFTFFVKKMPVVPLHYDYAIKTKAFYKEVEIYNKLFKDFKKAQKPLPDHWHPKFYYSRDSELIVLEDISVKGYRIVSERAIVDEKHLTLALISMARMHAASIIFEEKYNAGEVDTEVRSFVRNNEKVSIGDIYSYLTYETEASDIKEHPGNVFYENGFRSVLATVDLLSGYTSAEIEIIKSKLPDALRRMFKFVKPSQRYRNVFLHGDIWCNNLMFRYDENGEVDHAIIIDFQLARYSPPAHDVIMLLYLHQTKEFLDQNTEKLLKCYFSELSDELRRHDLDCDKLLPWEEFRESYDYLLEYAIITCVLYFQMIFIPSDIMGKYLKSQDGFEKLFFLDRSEPVTESFIKDDMCRERVSERLNQLIKQYILK